MHKISKITSPRPLQRNDPGSNSKELNPVELDLFQHNQFANLEKLIRNFIFLLKNNKNNVKIVKNKIEKLQTSTLQALFKNFDNLCSIATPHYSQLIFTQLSNEIERRNIAASNQSVQEPKNIKHNSTKDAFYNFDSLIKYLKGIGFKLLPHSNTSHLFKLEYPDYSQTFLNLQPDQDGKIKVYQLQQVQIVLDRLKSLGVIKNDCNVMVENRLQKQQVSGLQHTTTTSVDSLQPTTTSVDSLQPTTTSVDSLQPTTTSVDSLQPTTTSVDSLQDDEFKVDKLITFKILNTYIQSFYSKLKDVNSIPTNIINFFNNRFINNEVFIVKDFVLYIVEKFHQIEYVSDDVKYLVISLMNIDPNLGFYLIRYLMCNNKYDDVITALLNAMDNKNPIAMHYAVSVIPIYLDLFVKSDEDKLCYIKEIYKKILTKAITDKDNNAKILADIAISSKIFVKEPNCKQSLINLEKIIKEAKANFICLDHNVFINGLINLSHLYVDKPYFDDLTKLIYEKLSIFQEHLQDDKILQQAIEDFQKDILKILDQEKSQNDKVLKSLKKQLENIKDCHGIQELKNDIQEVQQDIDNLDTITKQMKEKIEDGQGGQFIKTLQQIKTLLREQDLQKAIKYIDDVITRIGNWNIEDDYSDAINKIKQHKYSTLGAIFEEQKNIGSNDIDDYYSNFLRNVKEQVYYNLGAIFEEQKKIDDAQKKYFSAATLGSLEGCTKYLGLIFQKNSNNIIQYVKESRLFLKDIILFFKNTESNKEYFESIIQQIRLLATACVFLEDDNVTELNKSLKQLQNIIKI